MVHLQHPKTTVPQKAYIPSQAAPKQISCFRQFLQTLRFKPWALNPGILIYLLYTPYVPLKAPRTLLRAQRPMLKTLDKPNLKNSACWVAVKQGNSSYHFGETTSVPIYTYSSFHFLFHYPYIPYITSL